MGTARRARSLLGSVARGSQAFPPARAALSATTYARALLLIRNSGVFDVDWYQEQLADEILADMGDPIKHYLRHGVAAGVSPSPLFDPRSYVREVEGARSAPHGPFVHYLRFGAARDRQPHPAFDVGHYLEQEPHAVEHAGGPLGHYLEVGWRRGATINSWFDDEPYRQRHPDIPAHEPAVLHFLRGANTRLWSVPDHRDFPRQYRRFDHDRSARFVEQVTRQVSSEHGPLVTVVMPVRDRADGVGAAIRSVLAQTYQRFELVVVDDGSVDGTPAAVRTFDDDRIRLLEQPASGVCRARNRAIAEAQGELVAYLDSDNTWEPRFLEVMVGTLATTDHVAAYSALEIVHRGVTRYRGVPLHRAALLEANYVDCNTLVHDCELAVRIGGWDESLPRANDWDFILRLSEAVEVGFAPFIGVRYDHDRERGDRISNREPFGWKYVVYARHHLDWGQARAQKEVPGRTSVVIAHADRSGSLTACLRSIAENTSGDIEVLVTDDSRDAWHAYRLLELEDRYPAVRVLRPTWFELHPPIALNHAIQAASGDVIVLLDQCSEVQDGGIESLVASVREGTLAAAQGPVIAHDGTIESTGYLAPEDRIPVPALAGAPQHAPEAAIAGDRQGLCRAFLAARRRDLVAVGGIDPLFRGVLADVDLTLRLREHTGGRTGYVPGPGVTLMPKPGSPDPVVSEQDQQAFWARWHARLDPDESEQLARLGLRATGRRPSGSRWASPDAHEPVIAHAAARDRPLRWAIKVSAPDVRARTRWGDWHFALALREALQRLGHDVVVDLRDGWYRPTAHLDDVVVVLRGVERYSPNPDQHNVVWIISHPDLPTEQELLRYDHRFAASERYAAKLTSRLGCEVAAMLQCTDADRFTPDGPDRGGERILFVGNSRGKLRPIVADALAAELPLTVYGAHWGGLVPEEIRGPKYVPNEDLPRVYRSAGVVLNDHWDDMRREAFLSNRLFDLAACGATIVSDHVEGIDAVFGGLARTYTDPSELPEVIEEAIVRRDDEAEVRRELSDRIRREHSFDARAAELHRVVMAAVDRRTV